MRSNSDSRQHWHARQLAAVQMGQQQHQPRQQRGLALDAHDARNPQPGTPAPAWTPLWSRLPDLRCIPDLTWRVLYMLSGSCDCSDVLV